ncbi:MAG TPA: tetratricopeptide repeat protein [Geopsychrobacteraceae bacterium]|nr:tetratricopeptide repeat protein [Geopsychrobacteraceae bacterium]
MKKETILLLVIVLAIGVLIGVIVTNTKNETAPTSNSQSPAVASAPSVDYQQKISMLERIVAKEPENRNAWVQLGHNYFDSDQPAKAIVAYDKALDLDDNDPNVLTDQGVMYRRLGEFDKAIANFKKANEVTPSHQQSLYNMGIVYLYDLKDPVQALEAWKKFLTIAPPGPQSAQVKAEVDSLEAMHSQGTIK